MIATAASPKPPIPPKTATVASCQHRLDAEVDERRDEARARPC